MIKILLSCLVMLLITEIGLCQIRSFPPTITESVLENDIVLRKKNKIEYDWLNYTRTDTGWQNVLVENFEGSFPSDYWDAFATSGYTDAFWDDQNYFSYAGYKSIWCAAGGTAGRAPGNYYLPNMRAWMIYGPFDLRGANQAKLYFRLWLDSELNYDYFKVGTSIDGNNFSMDSLSGYSAGWLSLYYDLSSVLREKQIWIGFLFKSDYSNEGYGAFLDNILIEKYVVDPHPPVINVTSAPTASNEGMPITVLASTNDPSGIREFYLGYFVGNSSSHRVNFSNSSATIPGHHVTASGLNYVIVSEDSFGNIEWLYYSVGVAINEGRLSVNIPGGSYVNAYRLFSVPINLENKNFKSFFSGSNDLGANGSEWRFFEYNNGFIEYTDQYANPLIPGKGYFIISKNTKNIVSKPGTTNLLSDFWINGIYLQQGWNLIGNPMPYDFELSDLWLEHDFTNYVWYWSGAGGWKNTDIRLKGWEGLAIWISNATTLHFNPVPAQSGHVLNKKSTQNLKNTEVKNLPDLSNRGTLSNWVVKIIAVTDINIDEVNYLGVKPEAKDNIDEFDLYEPPILPDAVVLYFNNHEPLAVDMRSPTSEGHIWEGVIRCKSNTNVKLDFNNTDKLPQQFEAYVITDHKMVYNIKEQKSIVLSNVPGERKLKIIIGNREFVQKNSDGLSLQPKTLLLHQNYPNPFNPHTTIRFELPKPAYVSLKIFNMIGEEIKTLVDGHQQAGFYEFTWEGKNNENNTVSSGIYIYRLKTLGSELSKKMLYLK